MELSLWQKGILFFGRIRLNSVLEIWLGSLFALFEQMQIHLSDQKS